MKSITFEELSAFTDSLINKCFILKKNRETLYFKVLNKHISEGNSLIFINAEGVSFLQYLCSYESSVKVFNEKCIRVLTIHSFESNFWRMNIQNLFTEEVKEITLSDYNKALRNAKDIVVRTNSFIK